MKQIIHFLYWQVLWSIWYYFHSAVIHPEIVERMKHSSVIYNKGANYYSVGCDICGRIYGEIYKEANPIEKVVREANKHKDIIEKVGDKIFCKKHSIHRDVTCDTCNECFTSNYKSDANKIPMGVSQWRNHGKKFGYWIFFEKEVQQQEQKRILEWAKNDRVLLHIDEPRNENMGVEEDWGNGYNQALSDLIKFIKEE